MIDVEQLKRIGLLLLAAWLAWGWWTETTHVRDLVHLGSSMGEGWNRCMTSLGPRVQGVEHRLDAYVGLQTTQDGDDR